MNEPPSTHVAVVASRLHALRALLRSDAAGVRAGFYALLLSSGGDLIAGLTLGSITGTLESPFPASSSSSPPPSACAATCSAPSAAASAPPCTPERSACRRRRDTLVGQNLAASLSMSLSVSLVLAILAKAICVAFGLENTISVADFVVISVIGGFLSSIVVMGITVVVAQLGVRRNWDLDNVTAPIVTAAGDMVTLPALFLATYLVGIPWLTVIVAILCAIVALVALFASIRSKYPILRRIARESLPVLVLAGTIDVIAGLTIEKRFESFLVYPALLVLVPPFLEDSGALGSILSARVSTKLHLGTLVPGKGSLRSIGEDFLLVYMYAVPVFFLLGVSADIAALVAGLKSPGSLEMIAVSMLAGVIATTFAVLVGFYGAVAAHRLGLDPDNHGIPIVTSSLDLLGAVALILVIVALGLT